MGSVTAIKNAIVVQELGQTICVRQYGNEQPWLRSSETSWALKFGFHVTKYSHLGGGGRHGVQAYNPSTCKSEAGGSLQVQNPNGLHSELKDRLNYKVRHCLKKKS